MLYSNIRFPCFIFPSTQLFNVPIIPIETYGCDILGYGELSVIEKVYTDFFKNIYFNNLMLKRVRRTRFPISVSIKKRFLSSGQNSSKQSIKINA